MQFQNKFKFPNSGMNNSFCCEEKVFILMSIWMNETSLPQKEEFYSNLNMEDITDVYYMHAKRACKDFEIKNS